MQKSIFNAVKLDECDAGLEPGAAPTTIEEVAQDIQFYFKPLKRVVPDLWRIDQSAYKVHALEVEDTSRMDTAKLCAYLELDYTLEAWGFDLRVWKTDRYGKGLVEVEL